MQETPQYSYEEDEIDLYELWLTIKKRRTLIFSIVFIFLLLSIIYCFIATPIYRSEFVIQSNIISSFQIKKYIDNLSYLLKERRYHELKSKLNISDIEDIKKISASIPRNQKNLVVITIEVIEPSLIKKTEKNILNFINNLDEVKEEIFLKKEELKKIIANLKEQIKDLENLRENIYQNRNFLSKYNIELNPLEINLAIKDLKNELAQRETQLALLKGATLAVEAIVPQKPAKPKKNLIIVVTTITAFFFGIFLAFFLEWLEQARRRYQEKEK